MDLTRVPYINDKQFVADLQSSSIDLTLFLRVFSVKAWSGVILTLAVIFLGYFITMKSKNARKVVQFFAWIMFVLLNAFYGGALTMFLSTSPSLPFTNVKEALEAHPGWKLFIVADNLLFLKFNESVYEEALERILGDYDNYAVATVSQAIDKIKSEPRWFCQEDLNRAVTPLVIRTCLFEISQHDRELLCIFTSL